MTHLSRYFRGVIALLNGGENVYSTVWTLGEESLSCYHLPLDISMGTRLWPERWLSWRKVFEDHGINCRVHGAATKRRVAIIPLSNFKGYLHKTWFSADSFATYFWWCLLCISLNSNHSPANLFAIIGIWYVHRKCLWHVSLLLLCFSLYTAICN